LLLPRDGARTEDVGAAIRDSIGELAGSALVLRLAVAIPAAAVMIVAAPWVAGDAETVRGLQLAALLGLVSAVYGCVGAAFRSRPARVPAILVVETSWHGVQLAASFAWVRAQPTASVAALLAIAVAVQLLQTITALAMWRTAFGADARIRVPGWRFTRDTLRRALPFAAAGLVANVQNRLAPLMLGSLSTQTDIGAFGAASRFATTARLAPGAIFAGALPVLTQAHGDERAQSDEAFRAFDRLFAVLTAVTVLPAL